MITPLDIETKEFRKNMRGYNEQEVTKFLEEVKSWLRKALQRECWTQN